LRKKLICAKKVTKLPALTVLPWFGLKQAENELKTTHVSDQRLSLGQNARFQK
jgi:hypothetical protein